MPKSDEFKQELQALLAKYDASIGFSVGESSDTHGLYNERIEVYFSGLEPGGRFKTVTETVKLVDGWGVDSSDLNPNDDVTMM